MKIMTSLILSLVLTSCLVNERASAQQPIEGLENVETEIKEHFIQLIENGIDIGDDPNRISIAENANEKFLIVNTDNELRMYLIVQNREKYETAFEISVEHALSIPENEEVELITTIIDVNPNVLIRSKRLQNIKSAFNRGDNLNVITTTTLKEQSRLQRQTTLNAQNVQKAAIEVDCVASDNVICCGFVSDKAVRIICVCSKGSNKWVLCFDSGWQD